MHQPSLTMGVSLPTRHPAVPVTDVTNWQQGLDARCDYVDSVLK
jgi:hypothetical protein